MSEIPASVTKLARQAIMAEVSPEVRWQYANGRCDHFAVVKAVAKAIMRERKRCADIARTFEDWSNCGGYIDEAPIQIANRIEEDI